MNDREVNVKKVKQQFSEFKGKIMVLSALLRLCDRIAQFYFQLDRMVQSFKGINLGHFVWLG